MAKGKNAKYFTNNHKLHDPEGIDSPYTSYTKKKVMLTCRRDLVHVLQYMLKI